MGDERSELEGFWLFEGLEEEPYGILPLVNLSGKGGPTSTKYVDRLVIRNVGWYTYFRHPFRTLTSPLTLL